MLVDLDFELINQPRQINFLITFFVLVRPLLDWKMENCYPQEAHTKPNDTHINVVDVVEDDQNIELSPNQELVATPTTMTLVTSLCSSTNTQSSLFNNCSIPHMDFKTLESKYGNQSFSANNRSLLIAPMQKRAITSLGEETELSPTTSTTSSYSNKSYASTFTAGSVGIKRRRFSQESSPDACGYISTSSKKGLLY